MPRYRFVIHREADPVETDLIEFRDLKTARDEAILTAGQMLKDLDGAFWENSSWQLDITDERGLTLSSIMVQGVTGLAIVQRGQ